jgi:hypothetical protein
MLPKELQRVKMHRQSLIYWHAPVSSRGSPHLAIASVQRDSLIGLGFGWRGGYGSGRRFLGLGWPGRLGPGSGSLSRLCGFHRNTLPRLQQLAGNRVRPTKADSTAIGVCDSA